uniref:OBG-type G domain-containing protein n=1 Tax=Heterorhabditis bacteriophora TaxID=37862 RepID=A0A1I7WS39_HETBA
MPPKKKGEAELRPALLGRLGTNLRIGILGLPNVGKSTFFNVLTKSEAQAENFPFCTIDPNESRVAYNDLRFDWLVEHYKPVSKVPAFLNVTDIAGLVKGASEGQGLGNAFLSHVSACDALFHLCRAFDDDDVTHVEGMYVSITIKGNIDISASYVLIIIYYFYVLSICINCSYWLQGLTVGIFFYCRKRRSKSMDHTGEFQILKKKKFTIWSSCFI